ncbi:hypothetical protein TNCV_871551 [Trichonephila clavipes]|nr:hypothetical protein TNCV_871551 [Trichonephila clavipes]
MSMNRCTNAELVDIHFIYALANGNGRASVRLFGGNIQRDGNRIIKHSLRNLAEHGSFRATIEGTGEREQHEHPYVKKLCCMLVTFRPMVSHVIMTLQDVFYLPSKVAHGMRGHNIYMMPPSQVVLRSHNYIGKHEKKVMGGAVRELARSAHVVSTFQTWTACDERESL